jgi:L-threonylcarbamoyladenylate synthase
MEIDNIILLQKLKKGSVAVMPTDTIYGILGSALDKKTVEKIYEIRQRNSQKPFIIFISSQEDLDIFKIKINKKIETVLKRVWPGKVSVILPCPSAKFHYLHRGTKSLAFRLPKNKKLLELLKYTGPLVAPSANPEGFPPAKTIAEAKKYFRKKVDLYVDGGEIESRPSRLIRFTNGEIEILR